MKLFLHTSSRIRIINEDKEFECFPERFQELEPDYPGLGGCVARYWTPERAYLEGCESYDGLDCSVYCDNIDSYTVYPEIYAHVNLSKEYLCVNSDPVDSITFTAAFKASQNPEDPSLPVNNSWFIRLRHEDGLAFDSFLTEFVDGETSNTYTYREGLPLGKWSLKEEDFDLVDMGGILYQIKLVAPIEFTMYREL